MPSFKVEPPESVLVEQGQTLMLDCSAAGEPAPVVTWHRESVKNPITDEDRVSVLSNNSLRSDNLFLVTTNIMFCLYTLSSVKSNSL